MIIYAEFIQAGADTVNRLMRRSMMSVANDVLAGADIKITLTKLEVCYPQAQIRGRAAVCFTVKVAIRVLRSSQYVLMIG